MLLFVSCEFQVFCWTSLASEGHETPGRIILGQALALLFLNKCPEEGQVEVQVFHLKLLLIDGRSFEDATTIFRKLSMNFFKSFVLKASLLNVYVLAC